MVEPVAAALLRAAELTAAGDPLAAISVLRPVLTDHPANSEAWCRLSAASLDAGYPDEALDAAKRAITLGERSWGHRLASLALIELGRREEAVVSAREAVRRDPDDWRCHVTLAEALDRIEPAEAVLAARRATELDTGNARPFEVLGDVALHAHDVTTARWAYRRALAVDPGNEHARTSLRGIAGTEPDHAIGAAAPAELPAAPPLSPKQRGVSRTGLLLQVRRLALWQGIGAVVLLFAGLPSPSTLSAWAGLLLLILIGTVGVRGWFDLPAPVRIAPVAMVRANPVLAAAVVVDAVALLLLIGWTIAIAVGSHNVQALAGVVLCAVTAALISTAGMRRRAR